MKNEDILLLMQRKTITTYDDDYDTAIPEVPSAVYFQIMGVFKWIKRLASLKP